MKEVKNNKSKWLHIRLSKQEWDKIHLYFSGTDHTKISTYAREVLLKKPIVGTYRNRSLEDYMTELIRMRKELNHIGHNFNQAVHKLHIADNDKEMQQWIRQVEQDRKRVVDSIEKIKEFILSTSREWLR